MELNEIKEAQQQEQDKRRNLLETYRKSRLAAVDTHEMELRELKIQESLTKASVLQTQKIQEILETVIQKRENYFKDFLVTNELKTIYTRGDNFRVFLSVCWQFLDDLLHGKDGYLLFIEDASKKFIDVYRLDPDRVEMSHSNSLETTVYALDVQTKNTIKEHTYSNISHLLLEKIENNEDWRVYVWMDRGGDPTVLIEDNVNLIQLCTWILDTVVLNALKERLDGFK